ncbi:FeoA family protein [Nibrella viscosa]|uniref:FeoA family protein n=1 Tax=Nibrella viscosa TaxID=1084524 RepID=A0ABP8JRS3_9BACT
MAKRSVAQQQSVTQRSVADLKVGEKAVIRSFSDQWMSLKLLEMGCLPGVEVSLHCKAPLGDPICLNISGCYCLSMRKDEAATILVA